MLDSQSDTEEKSTDDEAGFNEKGGTIAYMMQRFRSSRPTDPAVRRKLRENGKMRDFWWQRNDPSRRLTSRAIDPVAHEQERESRIQASPRSPKESPEKPRIPRPQTYTAQLTAQEVGRLKQQHLRDLRVDSESESSYSAGGYDGFGESNEESVSDPSLVEIEHNLERHAKAAISKAKNQLHRMKGDDEVGFIGRGVHVDDTLARHPESKSTNLNNVIDTLDLAMKPIKSREQIQESGPASLNANTTEEMEEKNGVIPLASNIEAPVATDSKTAKLKELIKDAAADLVPDHSRYRWYAKVDPVEKDSILDPSSPGESTSLAETASTEDLTPTKPSDIKEDLDIALLCLNNRLKGAKEQEMPLRDTERLAALKAKVATKVDAAINENMAKSVDCSPIDMSERSTIHQGSEYQPTEGASRQILQRDDRICLYQNFKLYERTGTNLVDMNGALRAICQTMKTFGMQTENVSAKVILSLARIPLHREASRHLSFDELATAYDELVDRAVQNDVQQNQEVSSDNTSDSSSDEEDNHPAPLQGVTSEDIRGLQRSIAKVLNLESKALASEEKRSSVSSRLDQGFAGQYPGDVPAGIEPIRIPLSVHPFPIHHAPAVALGSGPHFMNVPPPQYPQAHPSAPALDSVNPNLVTLDRNIMNSAVQAATIDYYKKLSENNVTRPTRVDTSVQASTSAHELKRTTGPLEQVGYGVEVEQTTTASLQWKYDPTTASLAVVNGEKQSEERSLSATCEESSRQKEPKSSMFQSHWQLLSSASDKLNHLKRLRQQLSQA